MSEIWIGFEATIRTGMSQVIVSTLTSFDTVSGVGSSGRPLTAILFDAAVSPEDLTFECSSFVSFGLDVVTSQCRRHRTETVENIKNCINQINWREIALTRNLFFPSSLS